MMFYCPPNQQLNWMTRAADGLGAAAVIVDNDEALVYASTLALELIPLESADAMRSAPREVLLDPTQEHPNAGVPPVYVISFPTRKLIGIPLNEILDENGEKMGTLWRLRDPDESPSDSNRYDQNEIYRKLFEKAIQINYQLIDTNEQLQKAQTRMIQQEKLASIGQLAAGVAHELNNPIGFVHSNFTALQKFQAVLTDYIDLLRQTLYGCPTLSEETKQSIHTFEQKNQIEFILDDMDELFKDSRDGVERITGIVQSLRQFSRVDFDDEVQPYDLNDGIRNTLSVVHNEIKYVAATRLELGQIPLIECIAGEVNQVLLNLVINAAQAIQQMGRDELGTIELRTWQEGEHVHCVVRDDGPGIPKHIQHKIYDPFFTTKDVGKGTGLGLNIAYDIIVNKHHGEIRLDSAAGRGTTFELVFPIHFAHREDNA